MLSALLTFAPIAALLTLTPGAATALVVMGARTLRASRTHVSGSPDGEPAMIGTDFSAARNGLITGLANPKLAVFFVALFPQFVPRGGAALPAALAMTGLIVVFDLIWYSALAAAVTRARRVFQTPGWQRRVERLTGITLIGVGVRLAFEHR